MLPKQLGLERGLGKTSGGRTDAELLFGLKLQLVGGILFGYSATYAFGRSQNSPMERGA